ncbi:Sulfotransferase [Gammaproteobacteria bacterium]
MTLPNFLIIGAAKTGTSALTQFLRQHPQVSIPYKEPDFFSGWNTRIKFNLPRGAIAENTSLCCGSLEQYKTLFANSGFAQAIGEASVSYLPDIDAPALIKQILPQVKLVVLLRQPADRAYSQFCMYQRTGLEPEHDFIQALAAEPERIRSDMLPFLFYLHLGHYSIQLARYRTLFSPEQMRIYLYEDWNEQPRKVWEELMRYLEIDSTFIPDFSLRHNENRTPTRLWNMLQAIRPIAKQVVPQAWRTDLYERLRNTFTQPARRLDPALRRELTERHFLADILKLQDMLQRDLSHWL